MSQVSIRDMEITSLKNQNKNLQDTATKKEQERKALENKCKELVDKNKVIGQSVVQGAKHIIWDVLIEEAAKLTPYLDYIFNK